jgi:hypothetical protein
MEALINNIGKRIEGDYPQPADSLHDGREKLAE